MSSIEIKIKVTETDRVTALLYPATQQRAGVTMMLGHGAGANQLSGFMRLFAAGLAARGIDVLTFNFLYTEQGRKLPDPAPRLESCYRAVIETAIKQKRLKGNRVIIGGKSMGGRIASQVAAINGDDIDGLVFLGYPLHPPGRPDKFRSEHLPKIKAPMLFVQGSRDAFGTKEEISAIIKKLKLPAEIFSVEGGDHSFKVSKAAGLSQQEVYDRAMTEIVEWLKRVVV